MLLCELQGLKVYRRESAYQCTPTTGYSWACAGAREKIYIDSALPFGLRSAPKVFCLTEAMGKLTLQINLNEIEIRKDFLVIDALKEAKKAKFDFKKILNCIANLVLFITFQC